MEFFEGEAVTAEGYRERMERVRKGYARRQAEGRDKGLLIVHTGAGKGKTTAAWGMALRALAHGMKVGIVQFIKGGGPCPELDAFRRFEGVRIHRMGEGFTWETQDPERDRRAAEAAWTKARELMERGDLGMLVLDEVNVALSLGQLGEATVLDGLRARPEGLHVVATGRGAPEALTALADLVTEMRLVKHPFSAGIRAQPGVEF